MGSGLYKHDLHAVREIIGQNMSNARTKLAINKGFVDVKFALTLALSSWLDFLKGFSGS